MPDSDPAKKETRSRSPFPHLPHLKLRGTKHSYKEPEVKSPVAAAEDKGFSLGKRRFSKRFRKRTSKQPACEQSSKLVADPDCDNYNRISPLNPGVTEDLTDNQHLNSTPAGGEIISDNSPPTQIQSPSPEPLSPKKKNSEHHPQRRRSVQVIRRAIDRLFTPKQKHSSSGESSAKKLASHEPHQPEPAVVLESTCYDHSSNQVSVNSVFIEAKSLHPAPLVESTPLAQQIASKDHSKMAQILPHPQDVAQASKGPSFHSNNDGVSPDVTVDLNQQHHPVVSSCYIWK